MGSPERIARVAAASPLSPEPVNLGQGDRADLVQEIAKHATGGDGGELTVVTDQPHAAAPTLHVAHDRGEVAGGRHPRLVDHHQRRRADGLHPVRGRGVGAQRPDQLGQGLRGITERLDPAAAQRPLTVPDPRTCAAAPPPGVGEHPHGGRLAGAGGGERQLQTPTRDQQLADQVPLGAVQRDASRAAAANASDTWASVAWRRPCAAPQPAAAAPPRRSRPRCRSARRAAGRPIRRRTAAAAAGVTAGARSGSGSSMVRQWSRWRRPPAGRRSRPDRRSPGRRRGSAVAPRRAGARPARWPARPTRPPRSAGRVLQPTPGDACAESRLPHRPAHNVAHTTGQSSAHRGPDDTLDHRLHRSGRAEHLLGLGAPGQPLFPLGCAARAWPAGSRGWPAGRARSPPPESVGARSAAESRRPATRRRDSMALRPRRPAVSERRVDADQLADLPLAVPPRRAPRTGRPAAAAARTPAGCCRSPTA